MRGRNPDNPSDRRTGIYLEQRVEVKDSKVSNCITTVQKDSLCVAKVDNVVHKSILHKVRTEYGKEIRKAYEAGEITAPRSSMQCYEPRTDGICNTLTTVQKDNLCVGKVCMEEKTIEDYLYTAKDGEQYGIFKLSPRECLRLMDVREEDIDKMLSVNSNSQCYKQAGNSIVVAVLTAIFSQLNIQGIKSWNDRTPEEREELIGWRNAEEK